MFRSAFAGGLSAVALSASLALSLGSPAAAGEVWRIQSLFPPDDINHEAMQQVADKVATMSGGRSGGGADRLVGGGPAGVPRQGQGSLAGVRQELALTQKVVDAEIKFLEDYGLLE